MGFSPMYGGGFFKVLSLVELEHWLTLIRWEYFFSTWQADIFLDKIMNMNYKMILIILLSIGIGNIHGLSCKPCDLVDCQVSQMNISNLFYSK